MLSGTRGPRLSYSQRTKPPDGIVVPWNVPRFSSHGVYERHTHSCSGHGRASRYYGAGDNFVHPWS